MKWDYSVREFCHVSRDTLAERKSELLMRFIPVYHVFRVARRSGREEKLLGETKDRQV